jgi:uncharacterized protein (TIGR02145 family)
MKYMKKASLIFSAFAIAIMTITSCGKFGASFKEVTIGEQIWMAENLDVDKFRNGDPIPQVKTMVEMLNANINKQPAWCYYDFDEKMGKKYGKLYNWYAVNDPRGIAPEGWHVPEDVEWSELISYLGGDGGIIRAATKLISDQLDRENSDGTNESKFNAFPGGYGNCGQSAGVNSFSGDFLGEGRRANWWAVSGSNGFSYDELALYRRNENCREIELSFNAEEVVIKGQPSEYLYYYSIRCVKDYLVIDEKDKEIKSATFGNQVWMTENLNVTKFRNGDDIPQAKSRHDLRNAADNKQPVWYYVNFDPRTGSKLGKLYNWWAVTDPRGLAPNGWTIPTAVDWLELQNHLCVSQSNDNNVSVFNYELGGDWWSTTLRKKFSSDESESEELSNEVLYYKSRDLNNNKITSNNVFFFNDASLFVRCVNANLSEPKPSKEVKIGDQIWTTNNLDSDKFRNGETIPQAKSFDEWNKAEADKQPVWCYYEFNEELGAKYGKLYNWYAVADPRGLAPLGYHIPTKEEWERLFSNFCDICLVTDGCDWTHSYFNYKWLQLKSKTDWNYVVLENTYEKFICNGNGMNLSGFNALPASELNHHYYKGATNFSSLGGNASWWSISKNDKGAAYSAYVNYGKLYEDDFGTGLSVRCVKD